MGVSKDQVAKIFDAAAELETPAQRAAFLDAACGQDQQLRAEVEELLRHDGAAGSFMSQPPISPGLRPGNAESPADHMDVAIDEPQISERPGTIIGPYKLLEQIGEGGFGVVFMAEQTHPVRRRVALKVLKPGMDTPAEASATTDGARPTSG